MSMTTPQTSTNLASAAQMVSSDPHEIEEAQEPESAKALTSDQRAEILAWVNDQFRACKDARGIQERQ